MFIAKKKEIPSRKLTRQVKCKGNTHPLIQKNVFIKNSLLHCNVSKQKVSYAMTNSPPMNSLITKIASFKTIDYKLQLKDPE